MGNELQRLAADLEDAYQFYFTDVEELDITDRKAIYTFVETHNISVIINCLS